MIAHDNPYVDLALDGEPPSLLQAPNWRECGIEFFSLSKGWCLGGFRLGFAVGAAPLIAALRRAKAVIDFNQSLALQQGAIQALQRFPDWPRQLHPTYRERRDRVVETLRARGWSVPFQRWRCTSGSPCLMRPIVGAGVMKMPRGNCFSAVVSP